MWQPIEEYNALPLKNIPKNAVFYFRAEKGWRHDLYLKPTIQTTRSFGSRVCTHWMPLPDDPK